MENIGEQNNLKVLRAISNPFKSQPNCSVITAAADIASLQGLCIGAVFMNHVEYWKQSTPMQYVGTSHIYLILIFVASPFKLCKHHRSVFHRTK